MLFVLDVTFRLNLKMMTKSVAETDRNRYGTEITKHCTSFVKGFMVFVESFSVATYCNCFQLLCF